MLVHISSSEKCQFKFCPPFINELLFYAFSSCTEDFDPFKVNFVYGGR